MNSEKWITETKYFTFDKLILDNKEELKEVTIAYETYGRLNAQKSNAILIMHAFTGDAHCAGYHEGDEKPGWWDNMVGPGKTFDTEKYFIVCSNILGGCQGSTGPSSINPKTGKEYGLDFPAISISDMVRAQKKLIDFLDIEKLFSIVGGSMGGMQVLQWVNDYPDKMLSAIPIATTMRHTPQQIAFNEVGRQSVMADIAWNGGHYYSTGNPERGLSVARMLGHITYMSDISMKEKFPIEKDKERKAKFNFNADFEVEEYLRHRGSTFVKRFDANSYLYISKAMDHFDVNNEDFLKDKNINIKFLVLSFKSDWLYPAEQSEDIVKSLKLRGQKVTYCNIDSTYGHDAFLLEKEDEGKIITSFLNNLEGGVISGKK